MFSIPPTKMFYMIHGIDIILRASKVFTIFIAAIRSQPKSGCFLCSSLILLEMISIIFFLSILLILTFLIKSVTGAGFEPVTPFLPISLLLRKCILYFLSVTSLCCVYQFHHLVKIKKDKSKTYINYPSCIIFVKLPKKVANYLTKDQSL